jgi:hypothetical protein
LAEKIEPIFEAGNEIVSFQASLRIRLKSLPLSIKKERLVTTFSTMNDKI